MNEIKLDLIKLETEYNNLNKLFKENILINNEYINEESMLSILNDIQSIIKEIELLINANKRIS